MGNGNFAQWDTEQKRLLVAPGAPLIKSPHSAGAPSVPGTARQLCPPKTWLMGRRGAAASSWEAAYKVRFSPRCVFNCPAGLG